MGERGMCVSIYDYAYYNQTLLGNKSVILYNKDDSEPVQEVYNKFSTSFDMFTCTISEINDFVKAVNADVLYILKHGLPDQLMKFNVKTAIHAVFDALYPHGDVFAVISPDVNNAFDSLVVPHMINLPYNCNNMREELNIPTDAIVFGRYGGYDQFNITGVQEIVARVARSNSNTYFLFMNTRPFCEPLPNIIHLDVSISLNRKVEFINTCNAMLWGRSGGETFGLSIGEFSSRNKPIFCMDIGSRAHIRILGDKAHIYTIETLESMLIDFIKNNQKYATWNWNAYDEYSPKNVMQIFKKVFLDDADDE
mgnify:CR=1 FL=1